MRSVLNIQRLNLDAIQSDLLEDEAHLFDLEQAEMKLQSARVRIRVKQFNHQNEDILIFYSTFSFKIWCRPMNCFTIFMENIILHFIKTYVVEQFFISFWLGF